METKTEEICGSFAVINEKRELKKVLVIQDVLSHYPKEKRCSKTFRLESINGVAVFQTEDPDIFQLIDGTLLKKRIR